jgi:hypothetical protein
MSALHHTYRYRPVAFTTTAPNEPLTNAIPFFDVDSIITGRRLVSLPFSDHCAFLANSPEQASELLVSVLDHCARQRLKYIEIRPFSSSLSAPEWKPSQVFQFHTLVLDSPLETIYSRLHKDCIQRKIRRANKEELVYSEGTREDILRNFYALMVRTRRRHGYPPQPYLWFLNLVRFMAGSVTIRLASKDGQPVAALLTLRHANTVTYKYGCSDERYNHMGGTPFLFWQLIEQAKSEGVEQIDLGRSDLDNPGLIVFKDRLGAQSRTLQYWRALDSGGSEISHPEHNVALRKKLFSHLPAAILSATGRALYRHMG